MSFFDEVDEPPSQPPPTETRGRRPSARGGAAGHGGPPTDQQAIQRRRLVAVGGIIVVIILLALLIHSCDVSAQKSALQTYAQQVNNTIGSSSSLGSQLFADMSGKHKGCSGAQSLYQCVTGLETSAQSQYDSVLHLSVPGSMHQAQADLVTTMKMRRDGLQKIAGSVEQAFTASTAPSAVQQIAAGMSYLYGSDVLYKGYALPEIVAALHAGGVAVGGSGVSVNGSQFVTDLTWLNADSIASQLGVALPGVPKPTAPTITVVAVGTNTMVPGVTNHVAASPPPTFTLTLTNAGRAAVFDVACTITVHNAVSGGQNVGGSGSVSELTPGQTATCPVTLNTSPATHLYDVTATVTVGANLLKSSNEETFPVQFLAPGQAG